MSTKNPRASAAIFAHQATQQRRAVYHTATRLQKLRIRASSSGDGSTEDAEEARLAALEASIKGRAAPKQAAPPSQQAPAMGAAEWNEGQLLPEGWESMDLPQRVSELWMGKRGALYWMTQSAWYSVLFLAFAWVVFRFVLPALGVYQLANDFELP